ncbi:hypothetical protein [Phenylobacterium sp.]|uniref:hypothetical protein n=1 Tax=Phenylobacterium sp. TaxID=1871053 RepID=UPI00286D9617|nr:hypothetical protein [Phenylobacterium sp.]
MMRAENTAVSGPNRRGLLAAAPSLLLAPTWAAARAVTPYERPNTKGVAGYSESAMVGFVGARQNLAASLRICHFPPLGLSWLWCNVLTPHGFYGYAHHLGSCGSQPVFAEPVRGAFSTRADGAQAELIRTGADTSVTGVDFSAAIDFQPQTRIALGPGASPGRLSGHFKPTHLHRGKVDTGRREQVGVIDAVFEAGGRRYVMRGPGKYHEQTQVTPRFVTPFTYLAFWGARDSGVAIQSPGGGSGALLIAGTQRLVTNLASTPPAVRRRYRIDLEGANSLEGELTAMARFSFPIFGDTWRGSFLRGAVGSEAVVGQLNDWRSDQNRYLPPVDPAKR